MNSIMERWVLTCRRELLDRTLIWNQRHLLHALRQYEASYNQHCPHQDITNALPPQPVPEPITDPAASPGWTSAAETISAASSTSTTMPLDLHGRDSRQAQSRIA
jgi:hypothetical protein